jgi:hypothetical protein
MTLSKLCHGFLHSFLLLCSNRNVWSTPSDGMATTTVVEVPTVTVVVKYPTPRTEKFGPVAVRSCAPRSIVERWLARQDDSKRCLNERVFYY